MLERSISSIRGSAVNTDRNVTRVQPIASTAREPMSRADTNIRQQETFGAVDRDIEGSDNLTPQENARQTSIENDGPFAEKNVEMALRELNDSIASEDLWDRAGTVIIPSTPGDSLQMDIAGANINEFSTDGTLAGDSNTALPTERAVKTYIDNTLYRAYVFNLSEDGVEIVVANGTIGSAVPAHMDGYVLTEVRVTAKVAGAGLGTHSDFQVRRVRGGIDVDMLTIVVTMGPGVYDVANGTVDPADNTVRAGDQLYIDIDAINVPTAPMGVTVVCTLTPP